MATYNIYGHTNGEDSDPAVVVTLNDDDTEIVSVVSHDTESPDEAESTLREYMEDGLSAITAIARYAGSYGMVKIAGEEASEDLTAAVTDDDTPASESSTQVTIGDGIMAMVEDDSTVVTLLKRDPEHGAVYRHNNEWNPLVDPTTLDGLSFVGVTDSAEAVYDKYIKQDKLVTLGHYVPSADGPFWPHPVTLYEEPETEGELVLDESDEDVDVESDDGAITASVTLNSVEDLDAAIAAAIADPDLQWYVERRVASLGLEEVDLPWLSG